MSKKFILAAALLAASLNAGAQDTQFKWYGFIRNYAVADSRESVYGTEDFFYYLPKDRNVVDGQDLNSERTFAFAAITSRLGLDVTGYQVEGWKVGAKLEADFYAGVSGVTGTALFRLRQAFLTMNKNAFTLKVGQAWHPMAADMPHVFALNTGAPFGPFSRTPQATMDLKLAEELTLTASALWQMQYTSAGPNGASADYIKYAGTPEVYVGLGYKANGFAAKAGVDVLSIKPRHNDGVRKVSDRITTVSPFLYAEYSKGLFAVKAKTIFAQAGEHMNLNGGYGVTSVKVRSYAQLLQLGVLQLRQEGAVRPLRRLRAQLRHRQGAGLQRQEPHLLQQEQLLQHEPDVPGLAGVHLQSRQGRLRSRV